MVIDEVRIQVVVVEVVDNPSFDIHLDLERKLDDLKRLAEAFTFKIIRCQSLLANTLEGSSLIVVLSDTFLRAGSNNTVRIEEEVGIVEESSKVNWLLPTRGRKFALSMEGTKNSTVSMLSWSLIHG